MEQRDEGEVPVGSIGGIVRSFVASKAYGFIAGDDGERYFVHQNEVQGGEPLVSDQRVTFIPKPTPKGSKATHVIPGLGPTAIYEEPSHFIVTNAPQPLDVEVILVVREGWAESNDPNRARQDLIDLAKSWGANAIINSNMTRYTKSDSCSNYKYTMHKFSGQFAVVKAIGYSSDPDAIAEAERQMQALNDWWEKQNAPASEPEPREPLNISSLVPPAKVKQVALIIWSWTLTICKILYLTGAHLARKGIEWYKGRNKQV